MRSVPGKFYLPGLIVHAIASCQVFSLHCYCMWVLRVLVAQSLVLEWPGGQQYHLSVEVHSASVLSPTSVRLMWVAPCHTHSSTSTTKGHVGPLLMGAGWILITRSTPQEGVKYSFTVTQTGFSGGRVLSVYARTFTTGKPSNQNCVECTFQQYQGKHRLVGCFSYTVATLLQTEVTV